MTYKIRASGTRTGKAFYSKTAYPIEGSFIGSFYIRSRYGETTATGRTEVLKASLNVKELIERAKIQAVFKHLNDTLGEQGWKMFYSDSDDVVQDSKRTSKIKDEVPDDIEVMLIDYIFEYPNFGSRVKYKNIVVKGRRYLQTFKQKGNRYVFDKRFALKSRTKQTRRMVFDE